MPLIRSLWLSTKPGKKAWLEPIIDTATMTYRFEVRTGEGQPREGTVKRGADICLLTGAPMPREHIRAEGMAGRMGTRLIAIVAEGDRNRVYLPASEEHERIAHSAVPPDNVSETEIKGDLRYLTPVTYGMTKHRYLFTARQLVALTTLCDLVGEVRTMALHDCDGDQAYADAIVTYLAFAVSKLADTCNALVSWKPSMVQVIHLFTRQAIPMVWDFAEPNVLGGSAGDFGITLGNILRVPDGRRRQCRPMVAPSALP